MASFTVALKSWVASTFPTKANNLSDLASAATARTNLGLGGAAVLAVGTAAGTVAAGDDSRITGAAQKASNLSDLASAAAARTNLGATAAGAALFTAGSAAAQRIALTGGDSDDFARVGNAASAAHLILARLKRNADDVKILVVGDSTGNEAAEWVYLWAQHLAADWPTHTVLYRLWNDGGLVYDAAVTVATGSGARTITIYNMSVSGWMSVYPLGTRYAPGIRDVAPDLAIVSLGHNEDLTASTYCTRGRLLALTEAIAEAAPLAPVILIAQNPDTSNGDQATRANLWERIAAERGFGLIDVHQHFIDAGTPPGWYTDTKHPNATGSAEWAAVVRAALQYQKHGTPLTRTPSPLLPQAVNLCADGNFSGYVSGDPTGWTNTNCTITKATTSGYYDSPKGYSVRLQSATAAAAKILWTAPAATREYCKGKTVTLAARIYVPSGLASSVGRMSINDGVTGTKTTVAVAAGQGGWRWAIIAGYPVAATASYIQVQIYADSGSTGAGDLYIDRVVLAQGALPRDVTTFS